MSKGACHGVPMHADPVAALLACRALVAAAARTKGEEVTTSGRRAVCRPGGAFCETAHVADLDAKEKHRSMGREANRAAKRRLPLIPRGVGPVNPCSRGAAQFFGNVPA
jgi:hypothetical protein